MMHRRLHREHNAVDEVRGGAHESVSSGRTAGVSGWTAVTSPTVAGESTRRADGLCGKGGVNQGVEGVVSAEGRK